MRHRPRPATWGIVIHWTAGHKTGDLATLTGGGVDAHFYVTRAGEVYQLLDADARAWHAFRTANTYCLGIEHEGSGEPWTIQQLRASARLARWLCDRYRIPIRHTDPVSSTPGPQWHGIYGHRDLAHIDANDHTDSVPAATGWPRYLSAIRTARRPRLIVAPYWRWLAWRLSEGRFRGRRADRRRRPRGWRARVPTGYWRRLRGFLQRRKTR